METIIHKVQKVEFEARIFVSLSIVALFCILSFVTFRSAASNFELAGYWLGMNQPMSIMAGYLCVALMLTIATVLRMWAGSCLSSKRIMAFKIQKDVFKTSGPFHLVRNPIYLADLIAFCAFALCLKPVALIMPVFLYLHYLQLVKYEESTLEQQYGRSFIKYKSTTPRFIPSIRSINSSRAALRDFVINFDGFRHNALYLLFIPGFVAAAFTGSLQLAIIIGLPAVIDWAIIHTFIGIAPGIEKEETKVQTEVNDQLAESKVFEDILYAQCWEDPIIDREAFQIEKNDIIFSITSGGCNVLAFLLDDPDRIISLDLNPSQNYLLDLKMAAFKKLEYDIMLEFLGVTPSYRRLSLYEILSSEIGEYSRKFWDANLDKINDGIIHCGRYENYMHLLRKWFERLMGKSLADDLFKADSKALREFIYETRWNNLRWRFFTKFFLSKPVMTFLFDKAFFAELKDSFSFGNHFRNVVRTAVTELPVNKNNFLAYILLGNYSDTEHLPTYLKKENFETIRNRLNRIEMISGSCEEFFSWLPDDYFSRFNFSNIFEWMPKKAYHALLMETIRIAKKGAILTYRNLLVPRSCPEHLSTWIKSNKKLSEKLHKQDLSFIYSRYIVEEINK